MWGVLTANGEQGHLVSGWVLRRGVCGFVALLCVALLCLAVAGGGAWTAESVTDVVPEGMVDSLARGA